MNLDVDKLVAASIEKKIACAKSVLKEAIEKFGLEYMAVAVTGGKDSTMALWLTKQACDELGLSLPKCMFIDEGDVFDEIWEQVNTLRSIWNANIICVKNTDVSDRARCLGDKVRVADLNADNRQELKKLGFEGEGFPFEPESFVGNHLMKTVPMNQFITEHNIKALVTAIRWDEQEARKNEEYFSPRQNPEHTRVHPILHFRERDIWDTTHKYELPFCSLYWQGYRSLGARCSTYKASDIPAWEQDLENTSERVGRSQDKEDIMDKLRDLGYM